MWQSKFIPEALWHTERRQQDHCRRPPMGAGGLQQRPRGGGLGRRSPSSETADWPPDGSRCAGAPQPPLRDILRSTDANVSTWRTCYSVLYQSKIKRSCGLRVPTTLPWTTPLRNLRPQMSLSWHVNHASAFLPPLSTLEQHDTPPGGWRTPPCESRRPRRCHEPAKHL